MRKNPFRKGLNHCDTQPQKLHTVRCSSAGGGHLLPAVCDFPAAAAHRIGDPHRKKGVVGRRTVRPAGAGAAGGRGTAAWRAGAGHGNARRPFRGGRGPGCPVWTGMSGLLRGRRRAALPHIYRLQSRDRRRQRAVRLSEPSAGTGCQRYRPTDPICGGRG